MVIRPQPQPQQPDWTQYLDFSQPAPQPAQQQPALVGGSPLGPQTEVPYMMDPTTGGPAMDPNQIAAGVGRRTRTGARLDPYSSSVADYGNLIRGGGV